MRYRKRDPITGELGGWVYTPAGEAERQEAEAQKKELEALRKEVARLKKDASANKEAK